MTELKKTKMYKEAFALLDKIEKLLEAARQRHEEAAGQKKAA